MHQQHQMRITSSTASACTYTMSPTSPSRRESTLSSDSGYHHISSTLSGGGVMGDGCYSRRESQLSMDGRRDSQMSIDQGSSRRSSSQMSEHGGVGGEMYHLVPGGGPNRRRDSAMSNDSLLSVDSVRYGGGSSPQASRASSGCASADGSTDSLLEQDLHKLSLSVTEQALE
jgi:hypothetical protein